MTNKTRGHSVRVDDRPPYVTILAVYYGSINTIKTPRRSAKNDCITTEATPSPRNLEVKQHENQESRVANPFHNLVLRRLGMQDLLETQQTDALPVQVVSTFGSGGTIQQASVIPVKSPSVTVSQASSISNTTTNPGQLLLNSISIFNILIWVFCLNKLLQVLRFGTSRKEVVGNYLGQSCC
ncbi:unnamed protein product [Allacma fusca]|uniref:Uncharacterized protein n=1 Tax=Allacma fusca TaxID=39272 RepID=A0A8J2LQC4_9HEXA|nr:unnamed protein product [Allacma fusca]